MVQKTFQFFFGGGEGGWVNFAINTELFDYSTQSLKRTSDKTIQFYYNLGKVKTSEDMKKARENIIRWFFWTRFPRYRGKRRLGMIQKSPILPSDVK